MKKTEPAEDEIIAEVRRVRAEHAAKFNYDFKAICRDYRRLEKKLKAAGWKVVSLPRRKPARTG